MSLAALLGQTARPHRSAPAVKLGKETCWTYGELASRVARLASGLRQHLGLGPGDRLAMAMKNTPEYVELMFAAWHAGLVIVPMNAKLHAREFAWIIQDSGAKACFCTPALLANARSVFAEDCAEVSLYETGSPAYEALLDQTPLDMVWQPEDSLAWLFYTSGTTGRPKGAGLSHRNLMAMTLSYFASVDEIAPGDCLLHAAPMSHGSGMYIMAHVLKAGVQVIPPSGGFDEAETFSLLPHLQGTTMFAAPTMVKRLTEHDQARSADVSNLKTVIYGGGPMYLEDLLAAQKTFGYRFAQIYGQGESPMTITALSRAHHQALTEAGELERLNSAGLPQASVEVAILGDKGSPLPAGQVGEIAVRGDSVMSGGYWNNPDATARTVLDTGWLLTGDLGQMDEDGYVTLTDRSKDVIISGGTNIYPREVEEILLTHPDVLEASVVGKPDADWGEVVVAFVVPRTPLDQATLETFCLNQMARFKRPKIWHFKDALPKNNYGKVLKTTLREDL